MIESHAAAAGWYPEPSGVEGQRWWDGTRWTEYATPLAAPTHPQAQYAPYGTETASRVPEGTPVDTVWVWVIVVLPSLSIIPLFLWDLEGYMLRSMANPGAADASLYRDPMYLAGVLLGWVGYGAAVVVAYLDMVALRRLGYSRQFHWAWAFLWSLVYLIGRAVVVRRQAGRAGATMWVAIALNAALFVGVLVWFITVVADVMVATMGAYPGV